MSDWERDANAALQALGEAWQQGGISRDTYRIRRRRLIASVLERRDETERRAVPVPAATRRTPAGASDRTGNGRGVRRMPAGALRLLVMAVASIVVAALAWMAWTMEYGNV